MKKFTFIIAFVIVFAFTFIPVLAWGSDYGQDISANGTASGTVKATAEAVGYHTVKVTWVKVQGATKYRIYRATSYRGKYKPIRTYYGNKKFSYKNRFLKKNKNYYYRVAAWTKSSKKTISNKMVVFTGTKKVTGFEAKTYSVKGPILLWNTRSACRYLIYRSSTKNGIYKKIATINNCTCINKSDKKYDYDYLGNCGGKAYYFDRNVKLGNTYYYKIRAFRNQDGKTLYSDLSEAERARAVEHKLSVTAAVETKPNTTTNKITVTITNSNYCDNVRLVPNRKIIGISKAPKLPVNAEYKGTYEDKKYGITYHTSVAMTIYKYKIGKRMYKKYGSYVDIPRGKTATIVLKANNKFKFYKNGNIKIPFKYPGYAKDALKINMKSTKVTMFNE